MTGDPVLQARTRSIDNLQRLYTFVIGLAITESLRRLLIPDGHVAAPPWPQVLTVASLLVTIIPFYHGANRYLDATYVTGEQSAKRLALPVDFVALFVEALWFFVLALFTSNDVWFYTGLGALLILDVLWVWITHLLATGERRKSPYVKWSLINLVVAACIFISVWSVLFTGTQFWRTETAGRIALALLALVRTVADYRLVWDFYYPDGGDPGRGQIPAPPPGPLPPGT